MSFLQTESIQHISLKKSLKVIYFKAIFLKLELLVLLGLQQHKIHRIDVEGVQGRSGEYSFNKFMKYLYPECTKIS